MTVAQVFKRLSCSRRRLWCLRLNQGSGNWMVALQLFQGQLAGQGGRAHSRVAEQVVQPRFRIRAGRLIPSGPVQHLDKAAGVEGEKGKLV